MNIESFARLWFYIEKFRTLLVIPVYIFPEDPALEATRAIPETTSAKLSKGGSKTETVTMRLSPRLKFALDLMARKQHRNFTSVAEWALSRILDDPESGLIVNQNGFSYNLMDEIWDPFEPDRFINLAFKQQHLLSYEEEVLWKLIRENGALWEGEFNKKGKYVWQCEPDSLRIEALREHWDTFNLVASGAADPGQLPNWKKTEAKGKV